MKKIIYIVCGVFIMGLIIENTNFIYAQNEEEASEMVEDNELLLGGDTDNLVNDYRSEKVIEDEETDNTAETITENGTDGLSKIGEIQTFDIPQTTQTIDTSNYGIIRIKDPNNTGKGITIHDRNLGATATGAGVTDDTRSYGFYFQWGNNYGFSSASVITTTGTRVDASDYGPTNPYSSDIFITGANDWSTIRNDNLRGGDLDSSNERGYPVTNASDRKGPCPDNYHVPSAGEWSKLLEFWADIYTGSLYLSKNPSNNLNYFEGYNIALNSFYNKLYIPVAGKLSYQNSNHIETGNQMLLRSSSPKSSDYGIFDLLGRNFKLYSNGVAEHRTYAFPIRCFYNSYRLPVIITYDIRGGYWSGNDIGNPVIITYTSNDGENYVPDIELSTPKRDSDCGDSGNKKCMFGGWYTLTGGELWIGNMIEDISLYANRLSFDDKDITLSGVNFVIMDRNLGAASSGTDENAYGHYLTGGEEDIMCPEGYHIPSTGEWIGIGELFSGNFDSDLIKSLLNLPFAGKIEGSETIGTGENAYYLAKNGDNMMYAKISNAGIDIANLGGGDKVSVRCFKDYNTGTIKFDSKGGNNISDITAVSWREDGEDLPEPTREHSIFLGWYDENDIKLEKNINYKNEEEIGLYAKWECENGYQENENKCETIPKKSGGSSGGGSRGNNSKDDVSKNIEESTDVSMLSGADDSVISNNNEESIKQKENDTYIDFSVKPQNNKANSEGQSYSQEFIDAYNFAYKNGITTKSPIKNAKMNSPLTRIQMAKMLSNYAINILGKEPDLSKGTRNFNDVSRKLDKEYGNAVTLAYQLGIMGQNIKSNNFRPNDTVTRAEFATALSRLLYNTKDGDGNEKYYGPHITKLFNEGIITKTNPTMEEKRGYVMIMLKRYFE